MSWKVTTEPTGEPVTLAEAKNHLKVSTSTDDDLITTLIVAAREFCEQELDLAIIEQTITLKLDSFPESRTIYLPRANLLAVDSVTYTDLDGDSQTYTNYVADDYTTPARIVNNVEDWPNTKDVANAVTIVYTAGFSEVGTGDTHETPRVIKQAMLMLIGHWYDNRQSVTVGSNNISQEVQIATSALLNKYRRFGV